MTRTLIAIASLILLVAAGCETPTDPSEDFTIDIEVKVVTADGADVANADVRAWIGYWPSCGLCVNYWNSPGVLSDGVGRVTITYRHSGGPPSWWHWPYDGRDVTVGIVASAVGFGEQSAHRLSSSPGGPLNPQFTVVLRSSP